MRLGLSISIIMLALSAGCGGASTEPATAAGAPVSSGGVSSGGGGENQQGRAVSATTSTATGGPGSAAGPTQADVLGRSGYGGEGYGAGPGAGGGVTGLIGGDRDHPVPTCGARESYLYVARDFQCPGGGNPLGRAAALGARSAGDLEAALLQAGAGARRGNVGPHPHGPERDPMADAHIVDQYEVQCGSGPVQVYVCLYHCPAGRTPMD